MQILLRPYYVLQFLVVELIRTRCRATLKGRGIFTKHQSIIRSTLILR